MFKLFSKKKVKRDVESQKRLEIFLQNEQEEIQRLKPIVENLETYDKELGRRLPKEFWVDGRQIRVFLGSRRHDTNYDLREEILWINYDLSTEKYQISHFSGQRGGNKEKNSRTIASPEEVFNFVKTACENYFSKHTN